MTTNSRPIGSYSNAAMGKTGRVICPKFITLWVYSISPAVDGVDDPFF